MKPQFTAAWITDASPRWVNLTRKGIADLLRAHRRAARMPWSEGKCEVKRVADGFTISSGGVTLHIKRDRPVTVPFVDVAEITEYGMTQRLSRAVRVF